MKKVLNYFSEFSPTQLQQFDVLENLYADWNQKINVISRKDFDNFYVHHVLHSLAIATQFSFPDGYEIMDLGAGGGFPGIPLAIFFPGVHFHLVDSIRKKLMVVEEISTSLGLTNVTVEHIRAEEIKNRQFDVVVSRAVAPLGELWKWSKPVLKKRKVTEPKKINGLICLKGGDLSAEISESHTRPRIWEINKIFAEEYFSQKFLLYVQS